MPSAPGHDYCAHSSDQETWRAEKHGDKEEHDPSAIEKALEWTGVTDPLCKKVEDVVKNGEDDEG
jgi:hypothetical protein